MNCTQDKERLSAWHDGALPEADRATVAAHLDACAECRATLDAYGSIGETLRSLPREKAPASILQAVRQSAAPNEIPFPQSSMISYVLAAAAALLIAVNVMVYFNNAPDQAPAATPEFAGAYDEEVAPRPEKAAEMQHGGTDEDFAEQDDLKKQRQMLQPETRALREEAQPPTPPEATEAPRDAGPEQAVESRVLYLALDPAMDRKLKDKADGDLSDALDGYRTRGRFGDTEKESAWLGGEKPQADDAEELADENREQRRGGRAAESFTIEVTEEEYAALTRLASSEGALVPQDAVMAVGALERADEQKALDRIAQGFVRQLRTLEESKRESADVPAENAVPQAERAAKGLSGGADTTGEGGGAGGKTDPAKAKEARWIRVTVYLLSREELLRRARELEKQQPADNP